MIEAYTLKNGQKYYRVKCYLGVDPLTGREKHTTRSKIKSFKEAKLIESRLKLEFEGGEIKKPDKMKFKEVCNLWLELYKSTVKPSTYYAQGLVLKNHVLPYFGDMFVDKITLVICQSYVNEQAKKLVKYHNSVNLAYRILNHAVHLGLIESNPATNVIKPKGKKSTHEVNWWNKEQLLDFIEHLEDSELNSNERTLLYLLSFTGMRKGEAMALYWNDIDFKNKTISIYKTTATVSSGHAVQENEGAKTKAGTRVITVDDNTLKALKRHQIEQKKVFLLTGQTVKPKNQLVFTTENNTVLYPDFANIALKKVITKHDLPQITVHQLRHTHCSLLFEAGATIKEVQERIGHEDYKTTMNIYAHVNKETKDKTADLFSGFLAL